jgi:hypothetical protein
MTMNDERFVSRRGFLGVATAVGAASALATKPAQAASAKLLVFLHLDMKQRALQELLQGALAGVEVIALTRHGDLERQMPEADALLALEPVLAASRLNIGPSGVAGGRTTEPYVLVGPKGFDGKNVRKIGALDLLGRRGTSNFVETVVGTQVEVERVTKLEDLLPLLQFQMVDAVLVPERRAAALKSKSQLSLVNVRVSHEVGLPALSVLKAGGNVISEKVRHMPTAVSSQLGVDSWR